MSPASEISAVDDARAQTQRTVTAVRRLLIAGCALVGLGLFAAHLLVAPPAAADWIPVTAYDFEIRMSFEGYGEPLHVRTFLPTTDERQLIVDEEVSAGGLLFSRGPDASGDRARWSSESADGERQVRYRAKIFPSGVKYALPPEQPLPTSTSVEMLPYLSDTETIQTAHPDIAALWSRLAPDSLSILDTLQAIHDFTHSEIAGADFTGTTDALTAIRLGEASCNGKSRLFVALARRANLPARLVGGLILDHGRKRTSHQWVEVRVGDHWVPFCPTNGWFAELPAHYLVLYRGDEALFAHSRDIHFDYGFSIKRRLEPAAGVAFSPGERRPARAERFFGAGREVPRLFLLFPLAALIVVLFKNVVGLETFGVFLPMLIAAACRHTGLVTGLAAFLVVIVAAAASSLVMSKLQILQAPRLSALITMITLGVVGMVAMFPHSIGSRVALLGLFPPVILGFTGERLGKLAGQRDVRELAVIVVSTMIVIALCFAAMGSVVLQTLVVGYPELLLVVVAVQLAVGRWAGLRLTEYSRFRDLLQSGRTPIDSLNTAVLGINARNLELVGRLNPAHLVAVADDKLLSKSALDTFEVPVPRTLGVIAGAREHGLLEGLGNCRTGFVIKPAHGSQGNGVIVIESSGVRGFRTAGGSLLTRGDLERHVSEITSGIYSDGNRDKALVEERILPHAVLSELSPSGLPDLRIILLEGRALSAMLRVPTAASGGRANLHQGAVGVPVDLVSGTTGPGRWRGETVERHPDTRVVLAGVTIPGWTDALDVARRAQAAVPLGYIGVDLGIDRDRGPLVIEVNARPGLEIQNVSGAGLLEAVSP